jgi:hypothetical protein
MVYTVTNYGPTRVLPVKGIGYNLTRSQCIVVEDEEVAHALGAYPQVVCREAEPLIEKDVAETEEAQKNRKKKKGN